MKSQPSTALNPLAREVPNIDRAIAEIARFSADLTLPKGTIHVISDIHGEDKKLRHVINNASGTLRPLVEQLVRDKMSAAEMDKFIKLVFYPAQVVVLLERSLRDEDQQKAYALVTLESLFDIIRVLASRHGIKHVTRLFPTEYRELFHEILHAPSTERERAYIEAIVDTLVRRKRIFHIIHMSCRLIRNLTVGELIIAGDCWDRGPRGDRVLDYLMQQPNVSFVWGNHDITWLGACLGDEALICHVLRISLRYQQDLQLEEGYGIPLSPLEALVREIYPTDPAGSFQPHPGKSLREKIMVARMQKAIAIMQWKLEGQVIARHPEWGMQRQMLLHRIDFAAGTIQVDGTTYELRDTHFPTIDPADPYELSEAERICLSHLKVSFTSSQKLWKQMRWMVRRGCMALSREEQLIFHGCVPVDAQGNFLHMFIDGEPLAGLAMFQGIERVIYRLMAGSPARQDLDLLWYLWCGPHSPLFGKDHITTLERDLIADRKSHHELMNPYFDLLNESWFCEKILEEFGVDSEQGLIINGHVPVRLDKGESPIKASGKAISIDGAFSEAYGDHGYTLVLEPHRTFLARHHHFESVEAAVKDGADIISSITVVREWAKPKLVADSERGRELHHAISCLEQLIEAYRSNEIQQR
jgi:fructose-1,6-bisphosphatase III